MGVSQRTGGETGKINQISPINFMEKFRFVKKEFRKKWSFAVKFPKFSAPSPLYLPGKLVYYCFLCLCGDICVKMESPPLTKSEKGVEYTPRKLGKSSVVCIFGNVER